MTYSLVIEYCASGTLFFQNPSSEKTFLRENFSSPLGFALPRDKNTISPMNIFEQRGVLEGCYVLNWSLHRASFRSQSNDMWMRTVWGVKMTATDKDSCSKSSVTQP